MVDDRLVVLSDDVDSELLRKVDDRKLASVIALPRPHCAERWSRRTHEMVLGLELVRVRLGRLGTQPFTIDERSVRTLDVLDEDL